MLDGVITDRHSTVNVVIYGSGTFDIYDINLSTVELEEACQPVTVLYRRDNPDSYPDILLFFRVRDMNISPGQTEVSLTGTTFDGIVFSGTDTVIVR